LCLILGINSSVVTADITPIEVDATLGIVINFILNDAIIYHGKNYMKIIDRNLGSCRRSIY